MPACTPPVHPSQQFEKVCAILDRHQRQPSRLIPILQSVQEEYRYLPEEVLAFVATSPYLFNMNDARELWSNITCPVLLFRGTESWASDPEVDGRATAFKDYQLINVPDAGHWVHHDQLAIFLRGAREFL